jgi:hypothetical protein
MEVIGVKDGESDGPLGLGVFYRRKGHHQAKNDEQA